MDSTSINIIQDNIISGATLLTINNPLVFFVDVEYTGIADDSIFCEITDVNNIAVTNDLYAIAYSDISATKRRYMLDSDQILRGLNTTIQEFLQANNTIAQDINSNTFTITFYVYNPSTLTDSITFNTLQGSVQFGNSPSRVAIYTNVTRSQIAYYGFWGYAYFYNVATALLKLSSGTGTSFLTGVVRAKINGLTIGNNTVNLWVNGTNTYTQNIDCREFCTGQKLIKFIDRNGFFQFYAFNKFYQEKINAVELGRTSKLLTNILTDQSRTKSIGKAVDKKIDLSIDAPSNDLPLLEDLFISPLIFMYIGNGSDTLSDWIEMKMLSGEFITRIRKGNSIKVDITLEYPDQYSITRF